MIRAAVFGLSLALAAPAVWAGVAEDAAEASAALQASVTALQEAEGAKDRVAALTATIGADAAIPDQTRPDCATLGGSLDD
jgi:murein hydrolase activator